MSLSPAPLMTRLLQCGRTVSLQLRGVLNWRTAAQFRHDVDASLTGSCRRVVVDLSGVEYVGGDILRALLELHAQLSGVGIELRLVVPKGSRCARSVGLTGLDRRIPTFGRPEEAWQHRHRKVGSPCPGTCGGAGTGPGGTDGGDAGTVTHGSGDGRAGGGR